MKKIIFILEKVFISLNMSYPRFVFIFEKIKKIFLKQFLADCQDVMDTLLKTQTNFDNLEDEDPQVRIKKKTF